MAILKINTLNQGLVMHFPLTDKWLQNDTTISDRGTLKRLHMPAYGGPTIQSDRTVFDSDVEHEHFRSTNHDIVGVYPTQGSSSVWFRVTTPSTSVQEPFWGMGIRTTYISTNDYDIMYFFIRASSTTRQLRFLYDRHLDHAPVVPGDRGVKTGTLTDIGNRELSAAEILELYDWGRR